MDELDALWAFLVAAVIAFAATPPAARLARRLGVVHYPRERDLHERPVPGLGGLAILAAAVVAALLFLPGGRETRGIVGGAIAIALVGAVDDIKAGGLHPLVKFAGQLAAAADPGLVGRAGGERDAAVRGSARPRRLGLPPHPARDRRGHERRELHRWGRRPRGGRVHDRRRDVRDHRAVARPCRRRHPRRPHRRGRHRFPLAQLPPRVDLHGRRGRPCSACSSPAWRSRGC